jgi:hypothetical protein
LKDDELVFDIYDYDMLSQDGKGENVESLVCVLFCLLFLRVFVFLQCELGGHTFGAPSTQSPNHVFFRLVHHHHAC